MKAKWYTGYKAQGAAGWVAFKSETTPTQESHGHLYIFALGPFKTMRAARWMEVFGLHNIHCTHVNAIERLARMS